MLDGGHYLNFPPDSDEVRLRLDLGLLDRFDGDLNREKGTVTSFRDMNMAFSVNHLLSRFFVDTQLDFSIRSLAQFPADFKPIKLELENTQNHGEKLW